MSLILPPLALYVHIPWCIKKCPYCDFNSHQNTPNALPEAAYLEKLKLDLQQDLDWVQGRKLQSIFFGGGTPSLFSAKGIATILDFANSLVGFEKNIEITLEANPGTFEQNKFAGYRKTGVNRLSLGVQSFQPQHLEKLGRIHSDSDAIDAFKTARKVGFDNINIDIMHGLPQQTIDDAKADLEQTIFLEPNHISWYQLTIEPNTVFYRQQPSLPADDTLADIQDMGFNALYNADYLQYEVSAFAKKGQQAKHNLNYWQFGDYIGIGAGAHGKSTLVKQQNIVRRQKTRLPEHYLQGEQAPKYKEHTVDKSELPLEFLMNALRLNQGVPKTYFSQRTGLDWERIHPAIEKFEQQGLLEKDTECLKTSPLGQQFLNSLLSQIMDEL